MGMDKSALELIRVIETCFLPRLPVDCDADEQQVTAHYRTHGNSLKGRIGMLRRRLADIDISQYPTDARLQVVTTILILLHELRSKGPWSPEGFANHAVRIEEAFTGASNMSLERFAQDAGEFRQAIFDACLAQLHSRLTRCDWKKYPAAVEVYCTFLNQIEEYHGHIQLDPVKILPAALLLVEDFNEIYKRKGLELCLASLKCLDEDGFKNSNYQQVIYGSLVKVISEKDVEVLKIAFACLAALLPLFPPVPQECKWNKFDELVKDVLEDIYLETKMDRKAVCLDFLSNLIEFRKADSVRHKKTFNLVMCDNLDLCSAENARQVLMPHLLVVLKTWLKYCWWIWKLDTDKKILSLLFKLLFIEVKENSKNKTDELEAIIVCLISLCSQEQQGSILQSLKEGESTIENKMYTKRLKHIQKIITEETLLTHNKVETTKKGKERRNKQTARQ